MKPIAVTPLDRWTSCKIGRSGKAPLQRNDLARYQLEALNHTLARARRNSPFYRKRLAGLSLPLVSLGDLAAVPFTSAADLRQDPLALLCVSQDRIARAVTLETSGTTGRSKRLFFTDADLELTVDFFHHGMSTLVQPGQRVLILMPGHAPGSVGDLLTRGLARLPARAIVHGPVHDPATAVRQALEEKADSLVGIPVQVLAMACHPEGRQLAGQIRSVLLSTDYIPDALVTRIEGRWQCRVFNHYGLTEMGLGGGVACAAHSGYHFREADLLVEIVAPDTGQSLADGTAGEIVFTTLTREGMPLIRYRTGDLAAFRVDLCPCGTLLKTLDRVRGRLHGTLPIHPHETLFISDLDEAVFSVEGVVNYAAAMETDRGVDRLTLRVETQPSACMEPIASQIHRNLRRLAPIRRAMDKGVLKTAIMATYQPTAVSTGVGKRTILDFRQRNATHERDRASSL